MFFIADTLLSSCTLNLLSCQLIMLSFTFMSLTPPLFFSFSTYYLVVEEKRQILTDIQNRFFFKLIFPVFFLNTFCLKLVSPE